MTNRLPKLIKKLISGKKSIRCFLNIKKKKSIILRASLTNLMMSKRTE